MWGWWGCKIACERRYFFNPSERVTAPPGAPNIHLNRPFKVSLRSWRYCVVVEWDVASKPLWYSRVRFDGGVVTSGQAARNSTASSLLLLFGTRLRRQNFNLALTQYRQLRRLFKVKTGSVFSTFCCVSHHFPFMIWWRAYVCKFMNRQKGNSLENIMYVVWIGKTTWFHGRDTFVFSQGNVTKNSPIVVPV